MAEETKQQKCDKCVATRDVKPTKTGEPRLPRGWQRWQDQVWCDKCWHTSFKLRAIQVPLRMITDEQRATLRAAWAASRAVANASVQALLRDDELRTPAMQKLGPPPKTYLYPIGRAAAPELSTRSVVAITHAVQGKYNSQRWEVLWHGVASPPVYRRYPVPIPPDCYKLRKDDDGWHIVSVRITDKWMDLRLDRSKGSRRPLSSIDQIISGEAKGVEAAIMFRPAHKRDHRTRSAEAMIKVVVWSPRGNAKQPKVGPLEVMTTPDVFLVVNHGEWEDGRRIQGDHVRTWIAGHAAMLARIKERPQGKEHKQREYDQRCAKQRNRIDSFIKMTAAQLRRWAGNSNASAINFDDSYRDYFLSFPWSQLRQAVSMACDDLGIACNFTRGDDSEQGDGKATSATARKSKDEE